MTISVLVTGDRNLADVGLVQRRLDRFCAEWVIVGDCPTGADYFTREWCAWRGVRCEVFRADWQRLGKAAGPRRNRSMVRRIRELCGFVLAFPRGGPGTANCIELARRVDLPIRVS